MNLRKKTVWVIGATIVILTGLLYWILSDIFLSSFRKLEYDFTENEMMSVLDSFSGILEELKTKSSDWAMWDDNYRFVQTGDPKFIQSNLTNYAFSNLKLNYVIILNKNGKFVYRHAHDLKKSQETAFPKSLEDLLKPDSPLLKHEDVESIHAGLLNLPEGVLLLVSRPIITSQHEGPIQGTLVFGRYLNDAQLQHLSRMTQHVLSVERYDAKTLPPDFEKARSALSSGQPFYIQGLSPSVIAGYAPVQDIFGQRALIVRIDQPRSIFKQGLLTLRYLILSVILSGLVSLIVILLLLEKFILSRLADLGQKVKEIAEKENLSVRVNETGNDELAQFAKILNRTLEQLEATQKEIKNSEEWFRILFEFAPDAIYLNNSQGVLMDANLKTQQLLGLSKQQIVGKSLSELHLMNQKIDSSYEGEPRSLSPAREFVFIDSDGNSQILEIHSFSITFKGQDLILSNARDITERKSLEKMKEDFLFTVSHELRTPLAIVKAFLGNLQAGTGGTLNEKQSEIVDATVRNVNRLTRLINDLLDFSRLESGKAKINRKACSVISLLKESLDSFQEKAKAHGITLQAMLPENLPPLYVDGDMIIQVLFNLLDNAFRFAKSKVELSCCLKDSNLEIAVFDDGEGIAPGGLDLLFNKFQQINRPSGGAGYKGTGLGLAVCKEIIRLHQGKIWAESEVGRGTSFHFTLPLAPLAIKGENT